MQTRILLVDDHQIIREGLRLLLQREPGFDVVGEADNVTGAVDQMRNVAPNLIVMDLHLRDNDGIAISRKILSEFPRVKILILSAIADANLINQALDAGAKGFVLKTRAAEEFVKAIHSVMAGNSYFCSEASQLVIQGYQQILAEKSRPARSALSPREREVLKLTAQGMRIKEIAEQLKISPKTVETHRSNLMDKLACGSTAELTRYAIREGISPI